MFSTLNKIAFAGCTIAAGSATLFWWLTKEDRQEEAECQNNADQENEGLVKEGQEGQENEGLESQDDEGQADSGSENGDNKEDEVVRGVTGLEKVYSVVEMADELLLMLQEATSREELEEIGRLVEELDMWMVEGKEEEIKKDEEVQGEKETILFSPRQKENQRSCFNL